MGHDPPYRAYAPGTRWNDAQRIRQRTIDTCRRRYADGYYVALLIPATLAEELPSSDGVPIVVRLFGEKLVAFRDSEGQVGPVEDACPTGSHRCSSPGTKSAACAGVYHGWKFDRDGRCTDMPSEPPDSLFKARVTIKAYPTHEAGGVV